MAKELKTYDYIVVLKSNSFKLIDAVSQLLLLIAVAAFLYNASILYKAYNVAFFSNRGFKFIIFSIIIIIWWLNCLRFKQQHQAYHFRFALVAAAFGWYLFPQFYFFIAYLITAFIEKPLKVNNEIAFDKEEVVMNSFPPKKISWNTLNNVVIKDGILTLDFKNNKLFQKEISDDVSKETEAEFNNYCEEQLKAKG
jgi:hypothetical protein